MSHQYSSPPLVQQPIMLRSVRSSPISTILCHRLYPRQNPQTNKYVIKKQFTSSSTIKRSPNNNKPTSGSSSSSYNDPTLDPHQVSDSMIRSARTEVRIPGTEALNEIPPETHYKNYALALTLVGFVTSVWYYSMQAVGSSDGSGGGSGNDGMNEFLRDAESAREAKKKRDESEKSANELAQLDITMSQLEKDGALDGDDVMVAVAADDEVAQREEDLNRGTMKKNGGGSRPLWKKVVFFWKKE